MVVSIWLRVMGDNLVIAQSDAPSSFFYGNSKDAGLSPTS